MGLTFQWGEQICHRTVMTQNDQNWDGGSPGDLGAQGWVGKDSNAFKG